MKVKEASVDLIEGMVAANHFVGYRLSPFYLIF